MRANCESREKTTLSRRVTCSTSGTDDAPGGAYRHDEAVWLLLERLPPLTCATPACHVAQGEADWCSWQRAVVTVWATQVLAGLTTSD